MTDNQTKFNQTPTKVESNTVERFITKRLYKTSPEGEKQYDM